MSDFQDYPKGAIRYPEELKPGITFYAVTPGFMPERKTFRSGTSYSTWNVGRRTVTFPADFMFLNYWDAYAYSLRAK